MTPSYFRCACHKGATLHGATFERSHASVQSTEVRSIRSTLSNFAKRVFFQDPDPTAENALGRHLAVCPKFHDIA